MRLKSIYLALQGYGKEEGRYPGSAEFETGLGTVKLNLDPQVSEAILRVCAEQIVTSAKSIGRQLSLAAMEATRKAALEHKAPDEDEDL